MWVYRVKITPDIAIDGPYCTNSLSDNNVIDTFFLLIKYSKVQNAPDITYSHSAFCPTTIDNAANRNISPSPIAKYLLTIEKNA